MHKRATGYAKMPAKSAAAICLALFAWIDVEEIASLVNQWRLLTS
jgi:hypothetical protein